MISTIIGLGISLIKETKPLVEYKYAFVIKTEVDLRSHYALPAKFSMSDNVLRSIVRNITVKLPSWFDRATNGKVKFTPTVIFSKTPVTTYNKGSMDGSMLNEALNEVLQTSSVNEYDGVGVVFQTTDPLTGYTLPTYSFGWAGAIDGHFGVMTVGVSDQLNEDEEVFWHEWFHTVDEYYREIGCPIPPEGVHETKNYDYKFLGTPSGAHYHNWYVDYLNANLKRKEGTIARYGISEAGFREPAPRLSQARTRFKKRSFQMDSPVEFPLWMKKLFSDERPPENAIRRSDNLLPLSKSILCSSLKYYTYAKKGGFQESNTSGDDILFVRSFYPDHVDVTAQIKVDPNKSYLISGWIKYQGVKIREKAGNIPFQISINGHAKRNFAGSQPAWHYFQIPFTPGKRTNEVSIKLALGGVGSVSVGDVALKNLRLELLNWN